MQFQINDFEGPLDLLLQLIKSSKMDIFNIEIESIVDQYVSFISNTDKINIDSASEYFLLASELIEIKSRLLLPKGEEEEEEDPRTDLVNRLIEYENYKNMSSYLKEKSDKRSEIYTKYPDDITKYIDEDNISVNISIEELIDALKKHIERKEEEKPLSTKVTISEVSVKDRKKDINKLLLKKSKLNFLELFDNTSKEYLVATFIAVLEMVKEKEIVIYQDKNFSDIFVEAII